MYAARGNHPHSCQELLINGADVRMHNLNDDTAHNIAVENNSILGIIFEILFSNISNFLCFQLKPL